MALTYNGAPGVYRVNGRPLKPGDKITDPQEIKDLGGFPEFTDDAPVKVESPKKASK